MLTILNKNADFWSETSNAYKNGLIESGYTLFTDGINFKRIAYSNGYPKSGYELGFVKVKDFEPTTGFTNNGSNLMQTQDAGLVALSEALSLDWTDGDGAMIAIEYQTLKNYITYPSTATVLANYIASISIVNYNQILNNVFTNYNSKYYLRDMGGENDVQITNSKAVNFNGTNQQVNCGNVGNYSFWAVELYFYSRGVENYRNVFTSNLTGVQKGLRLEQYTTGVLSIESGNDSGSSTFTIFNGLQPNTLYRVVITNNGAQLFFNVNGAKSSWAATYMARNFTDLVLGNGFNGTRWFKGDIISFKMWGEYLTQYEPPRTTPLVNYLCKENTGDVLYNASSDNNHGAIQNYTDAMWANVHDNIEQPLFTNGYEAYENDLFPNDKTKYKFVPLIDGVELNPTISGFTYKYTIPANVGISDVGSKFTGIKFSELALTYNEIIDYINDIPPKEDFTLTIKDGVITDMASQPYDSEGNLKSHL